MRRHVRALLVVAAVGLSLAGTARGDEEEDKTPPGDSEAARSGALPSDYYETATVRAQPLSSSVSSVTVIDRDQIEALDPATVVDVLRFVQGLTITSTGGRSAVATAQIRGGDPNFTVVLVDGVPLNDSTDPFGGAVNLDSLPVEHVERIEVVRGPVSSYYGSAGMAGVVNIITRRGGNGLKPGWSAAAGNSDYGRITGSLGGGEDASYFVGMTGEKESGRVGDDEFQQIGLLGNHSRALGGGRIDIAGRVTTWDTDDYADGSGGPLLGSGELRHSENDEVSLGVDWTGGSAKAEQRARASGYWHRVDRATPAIAPVVPASEEATRYVDARLGWDVSLAVSRHGRLAFGVEGREEQGRNESTLFLPPAFGGPTPGDYDLDRTTVAVLADWTGTAGHLSYEAGARFDWPEGFDSQVSPRVGVAWRFGKPCRLRFSFARSFKLPSFYALGSPPALAGNPDLAPERSTGGDLGVELQTDDGSLRGSLTAFAMRYEDLIDIQFDPTGPPQLVNRAEVDSRGAELALSWVPSTVIDLRLNVTYQDVTDRDADLPLRRRPHWVGGLRATYRPVKAWRIEADVASVSDQNDEQIPAPTRDTVDGSTLVGAGAAYHFSTRWSATLRADNLLDEEYETLIGFPGPARSFRVGIVFGGGGV